MVKNNLPSVKRVGHYVRAPEGYEAFVPNPLPPQIDFTLDMISLLSSADAALSELSGVGRLLPNPHLLISTYLRREAVLSSKIEGTRTTFAELLQDEMENDDAREDADMREVRNYVAALEQGIDLLKSLPFSLRLVREVHAILMKGVRGNEARPGEFRKSQNWIGPPRSTPETATLVPPPPQEMQKALGEWEVFANTEDQIPALVKCALLHHQFETIHPFLDGNGRVGRLLITLYFMAVDRLSQPLLYLSAYFEADRRSYYEALQSVRTEGDWTPWIMYFLIGVERIAKTALRQSKELISLREEWLTKLQDAGKARDLVDTLLGNPYITVAYVENLLRMSNPTARRIVNLLVEREIVQPIDDRKWNRVFIARPIMNILESL